MPKDLVSHMQVSPNAEIEISRGYLRCTLFRYRSSQCTAWRQREAKLGPIALLLDFDRDLPICPREPSLPIKEPSDQISAQ